MGAAVAGPETAAGDLVGAVLRRVLAEVLSTSWLIGVLLLLAIAKVVGLSRAIVRGGRGAGPSPHLLAG